MLHSANFNCTNGILPAVHAHNEENERIWAFFNSPPKAPGSQPNPTLEVATSSVPQRSILTEGAAPSTSGRAESYPRAVVSKPGLPSAYLEAGHLAGTPRWYSPISSSPCCSLPCRVFPSDSETLGSFGPSAPVGFSAQVPGVGESELKFPLCPRGDKSLPLYAQAPSSFAYSC